MGLRAAMRRIRDTDLVDHWFDRTMSWLQAG
jgi:hypothetical protein